MSLIALLTSVGILGSLPTAGEADRLSVVHPAVWDLLDREGAPAKVWVFLTDKGFVSDEQRQAAIGKVQAEYNPRAVQRRALRGTAAKQGGELFTIRDVPVARRYVAAIAQTKAEICVESRWLNAVSVRADAEQVARIARLSFVREIRPIARARRIEPVESRKPAPTTAAGGGGGGSRGGDPFYGLSYDQLAQINLVALHEQGYTGSGMIIGLLDTGFARFHEALTDPNHPIDVLAEWDFVDDDPNAGWEPNDPVVPDPHGDQYQHAHGTIVLGTIAGYKPGVYVGGAYDASFILAKTEDITDEYPAEEDLYVAGLEFIEMNGADVASSSLGYYRWYDWFDMDGQTAVTTIGVNIATSLGLVCCTAAGNGGRDQDLPTLNAPGDAFDVITCGAVNPYGTLADFSSGGPTADGRIKPEVLARGVFVYSIDPLDETLFDEWDGTSMSTPLVASAVTCILQAHPCWGVHQIRSNLFGTASDYVADGEPDPNFARGYGIIDVYAASQTGACIGDLDENGEVDLADLAQLLASYSITSGAEYEDGDLDCDGDVDLSDLAALLAGYGTTCP
jgi:subtilisin family serine protease